MKTNQPPRNLTWSRWIFGWNVHVEYSRDEWFVTDSKGYRNALPLTYMVTTESTTGQQLRRIIIWRFLLAWGRPLQHPPATKP